MCKILFLFSLKNVKKLPHRAAGQGQLNAISILLKILWNGKLSSQKQSLKQELPHRAAGQGQLNAINILQETLSNCTCLCADFCSGYEVYGACEDF
jgi:hypothetical protein